jgi:hypothetical protein
MNKVHLILSIKINYIDNNFNDNISDDYINSCLDIETSLSKYRIC